MSIEAALAENTAAIRELIAAIKTGTPVTSAQVAAVVAEAPKPETEKVRKAVGNKTAANDLGTQKTAAEAVKALDNQADKVKVPSYVETASAITKLQRLKGRDAAIAVLASFNASRLNEVPESSFDAVIAACNEAMA